MFLATERSVDVHSGYQFREFAVTLTERFQSEVIVLSVNCIITGKDVTEVGGLSPVTPRQPLRSSWGHEFVGDIEVACYGAQAFPLRSGDDFWPVILGDAEWLGLGGIPLGPASIA